MAVRRCSSFSTIAVPLYSIDSIIDLLAVSENSALALTKNLYSASVLGTDELKMSPTLVENTACPFLASRSFPNTPCSKVSSSASYQYAQVVASFPSVTPSSSASLSTGAGSHPSITLSSSLSLSRGSAPRSSSSPSNNRSLSESGSSALISESPSVSTFQSGSEPSFTPSSSVSLSRGSVPYWSSSLSSRRSASVSLSFGSVP